MTTLLMIIGFGAATSVVVGLGQKLKRSSDLVFQGQQLELVLISIH